MKKLNRKLLKFILTFLLVFMISGQAVGVSAAGIQNDNGTGNVSMRLFGQDGTQVGVYSDWKSVVAKINSLNQKLAVYRVSFSGNVEITGKLLMPSKGKYGGLILENAESADELSIQVSGSISPTADLTVGRGVVLSAGSISGKAWRVTVSENSTIVTTAGFTVGELVLGKAAHVKSGGKLDVKKNLTADAGAQLTLTEKKLGAVKNTQLLSDVPLHIKVQNATGAATTLAQGATVLTVIGDTYTPQFILEDAGGKEQAMYRKAKLLKVKGTVETPYLLYDVTNVAREEKSTGDGDDQPTIDGTDKGTGDGIDQNAGGDASQNAGGDASQNAGGDASQNAGDDASQNTGDGADQDTGDGTDQNTGDGAEKTLSEVVTQWTIPQEVSSSVEQVSEIGTQTVNSSEQPLNMGKYASLADIRTEINRRKKADAVYEIVVEKAVSYKGTVTCPSAKAYKKMIFSGEKLSVTGSLKLTGDTVFENQAEFSGAVTGGKGTVLELAKGTEFATTGNLKVERLVLWGSMYVKGNVTVTDIVAGAGNLLRYNVSKKITIKGNVTGMELDDRLVIAPEKGGSLLSDFPEGIRLINSAAKVDTASFALYQETTKVFYLDKKALKLGAAHILLFEGRTDYEACERMEAEEADKEFVTMNDLLVYINGSKQTEFVAMLERNVSSTVSLTALSQGKHLILCGADEADEENQKNEKNEKRKTLQFKGGISLNGCVLEVRGLILDNKTTAGAKVTLGNGAKVTLENTSVNTIAAAEGTIVFIAGETTLKGALSGKGILEVQADALLQCSGNVEARELVLVENTNDKGGKGTEAVIAQNSGAYAEIRVLSNKKCSITNTVTTGKGNYFVINLVDKKGELATLKKGATLVLAPYAEASQFRTDNVMPKTFLKWALVRQGITICTMEGTEGEGKWSGDYL